jgi:hypothetical protein
MKQALRIMFQLLLYVPLMALIGYFSSYPKFTQVGEGEALVRLSVVHGTQRVQECRERTPEELAKMAPNMRAALDCPRERSPMHVELVFDGRVVYQRTVPPSGLRRDGAAAVYHRMQVPAGRHYVIARLRDRSGDGYNYVREAALELAPGASLVIDFSAAQGGFLFKG